MKKKTIPVRLFLCMILCSACSMEKITPPPDSEAVAVYLEDSKDDGMTTSTPLPLTTQVPPTATPFVEQILSPSATPLAPVAVAEPSTAIDTSLELSEDLYSFQLSIDGTVYRFPMWYDDFEQLGWTYRGNPEAKKLTSRQYTAAKIWKKDAVSVFTKLANLTINSATLSDCMVVGITLDDYALKDTDWEIILPKGIQYGSSTKEEILDAYGTPDNIIESPLYDKLSYIQDTYSNIQLYLSKKTGILEKIEMENIIELDGGNNTVDPTIPDIIAGYTAPYSVGNDLYQFNIALEDALYTLPCPISQLLENGFSISNGQSVSEIASGSDDWIELTYKDRTLQTIVHNYADYATILENCFVTSVESSLPDSDFALTIPCGIERGTTEADLLTILKKFNYATEDSSPATRYTVYHPEQSRMDGFTITTQGGIVIRIEAHNTQKPAY